MFPSIDAFLFVHIFILGIPMLAASIFLVVETIRIRGFLERYAIQQVVFRGILIVGYLFLVIAILHLVEHTLEWFGYDDLGMAVEMIWHAVTLVVLLVVSYTFYHYRRTLKAAEDVEAEIFK